MKKIVQTAGRDSLGEFAKEFAHFNDDVLFGEIWNNNDIDLKMRCIITVVSLISSGVTDNSLIYHLTNAKNNDVTRAEIALILHFMPGGLKHGLHLMWQKIYGMMRCHQMKKKFIKAK